MVLNYRAAALPAAGSPACRERLAHVLPAALPTRSPVVPRCLCLPPPAFVRRARTQFLVPGFLGWLVRLPVINLFCALRGQQRACRYTLPEQVCVYALLLPLGFYAVTRACQFTCLQPAVAL